MTIRCIDIRFTRSLSEVVVQRLLEHCLPIAVGRGIELDIGEHLLDEEMRAHRAFDLLATRPGAVATLAKEVVEGAQVVDLAFAEVRRRHGGGINHTRVLATQRLKGGDAA